jgi:hypothetical protein
MICLYRSWFQLHEEKKEKENISFNEKDPVEAMSLFMDAMNSNFEDLNYEAQLKMSLLLITP